MITMIDKIEDIAKRRGFFWTSSEIHGGVSGLYDYAHLGTLMKRRWESLWRNYFLSLNDNFYEIEACDIMPESVFIASGHLKNFVDPIVRCKKCGNAERADHILEDVLKEKFEGMKPEELAEVIKKHKIRCSSCGGTLEEVGILNMMFPLTIGTGKEARAYLRPETAQSAYVNFNREFECLRRQLPLGLAIIGKAYRNEISPRNVLLRMREFTQAELQIFFDPEKINDHDDFSGVEDYKLLVFPVSNRKTGIEEVSCKEMAKKMPKFYVYHMAKIQQFYMDILKLPRGIFRFKELNDEEKAFYNKYHWDIELSLDGDWKEVAGIHYRTDHDLAGHQSVTKQDMSVSIEGKKFIPHVLELSFGVDRNIYALFVLGYREEKVKEETRAIFAFPRLIAPFDCAVFPLVNKDNLPVKSVEIKKLLQSVGYNVFYDASGSIGRRYRRMDEIGVPACITIDNQTLGDNTVTLRDRDSMKQVRIKISDLCTALRKFLDGDDVEKLENK